MQPIIWIERPPLRKVVALWNDSKIPRNMKAAYASALKRDDMVHMMLNPGLLGDIPAAVINGLDVLSVGPERLREKERVGSAFAGRWVAAEVLLAFERLNGALIFLAWIAES